MQTHVGTKHPDSSLDCWECHKKDLKGVIRFATTPKEYCTYVCEECIEKYLDQKKYDAVVIITAKDCIVEPVINVIYDE